MKDRAHRKKRKQRYSSSLGSAVTIEPYKYYISDKHKRLKEVDAEGVKLDGITYGKTNEILTNTLTHKTNLETYVKTCEDALTSTLIEKGYNTPNVDLKSLVEDILKLNIIVPTKEYEGFKLVEGYVVGLGYDVIQEVKEKPDDFDKGYWKLVNSKWVLDNVRYQQIWGG